MFSWFALFALFAWFAWFARFARFVRFARQTSNEKTLRALLGSLHGVPLSKLNPPFFEGKLMFGRFEVTNLQFFGYEHGIQARLTFDESTHIAFVELFPLPMGTVLPEIQPQLSPEVQALALIMLGSGTSLQYPVTDNPYGQFTFMLEGQPILCAVSIDLTEKGWRESQEEAEKAERHRISLERVAQEDARKMRLETDFKETKLKEAKVLGFETVEEMVDDQRRKESERRLAAHELLKQAEKAEKAAADAVKTKDAIAKAAAKAAQEKAEHEEQFGNKRTGSKPKDRGSSNSPPQGGHVKQ